MVKLTTPVTAQRLPFSISLKDKVVVLGSCLSDDLGDKFRKAGFGTMVNPFGTLYNPLSIENAINRMDSGDPYTEKDCVEMGAGAGLVCSWEHYTKFARPTAEEFLQNANAKLAEAAAFWQHANAVIIPLYTAWVWEYQGRPVANCLKRPQTQFDRLLLSVSEASESIRRMIAGHPEKRFVFMVCPIRQPGQPRENTLGKATLQLAIEAAGAPYFPAFEIVHDELRDYRFYADDLVHPSQQAVRILWERLAEAAFDPAELPAIAANEKESRATAHRNICQKN
ncbi:MAG: GSCFA domain-containing protein [Bacteroidales bacterium]|nr:GSCFA domain-containing protein [Bacteroidales bacterium]